MSAIETSQSIGQRSVIQRGEVQVVQSTPEDRALYLNHLSTLLSYIKEQTGGLDGWYVIGGIARDALMKKENFVVMSPTGQWRDVDLLFSQPLKKFARSLRRDNPTPLPLSIVFHNFIEIDPHKQKASLQFGNQRTEVPWVVFQPQIVNMGNFALPTLPPRTLFHLYYVGRRPYGRMRPKDFLNARDFAQFLVENPDDHHPEELYRGFHEFSIQRQSDPEGLGNWLLRLAQMYKRSPLNRIARITDPRILPILERILDICSRTDPKKN